MICAVYKTKYKNRITHNTKNLLFIRWAGVAVVGVEAAVAEGLAAAAAEGDSGVGSAEVGG